MKTATREQIENSIKNIDTNDENKQLLLEFVKYRAERNIKRKMTTLKRQVDSARTFDRWLNHKPFSDITEEDMFLLLRDLMSGKVSRKNGKKYKSTGWYLKDFKYFMKWLYIAFPVFRTAKTDKERKELQKKFKKSLESLKARRFEDIFTNEIRYETDPDENEEPVIVTLEQAEYAAKKSTLKIGTLIMVAFDAGLRPEELANVRRKDITWNEEENSYFLYVRYPKKNSKRRTMDIPLCNAWLRSYLKEFDKESTSEDPLFEIKYDSLRVGLSRRFKELFSIIGVTMYTFRHSSIQYYVNKYMGNFLWMANRYGWSYSSVGRRLKDYIARSKVNLPKGSELVHADKMEKIESRLRQYRADNLNLNSELELIKQEKSTVANQMTELNSKLATLDMKYNQTVIALLKAKPGETPELVASFKKQ